MDTMMAQPTPEGEQPKTPAEVVAHVLPSSKFLRNVGLETTVPKRSATAAARVQELEAEVAAEKQGAAALRDQLHGQQDELEVLKKTVEESEEAREKQAEHIENLKKQGEEINAFLHRLFTLNKDKVTPYPFPFILLIMMHDLNMAWICGCLFILVHGLDLVMVCIWLSIW